MSRSGQTFGVRVALALLMGGVILSLCAPSASAAGCHTSERPVLGLPLAGDAERLAASGVTTTRAPAVVPLPCDGESPGTTSRGVTVAPAAPCLLSTVPTPSGPPFGLVFESPRTATRHRADRLDRPPRA